MVESHFCLPCTKTDTVPERSEICFDVNGSVQPRNKVASQLPRMICQMSSGYFSLICGMFWKIISVEINLDLIVEWQ